MKKESQDIFISKYTIAKDSLLQVVIMTKFKGKYKSVEDISYQLIYFKFMYFKDFFAQEIEASKTQ